MRAQILQHVAFEGPGPIADWLQAHGFEVGITRLDRGEALPDWRGLRALVVLGGPMSVHDAAEHPWLVAEKAFLTAALAAGVPTLGICLGAQLMACVLGAQVSRNPVKEIGWLPIQGLPSASPAHYALPAALTVFHWHGETFELPPGAALLAASAHCRHQAFQWGRRAIGLQCHLESTPAAVELMLRHGAEEIVAGPGIQTAELIRALTPRHADAAQAELARLLAYLFLPDTGALSPCQPAE